MACGTAGPPILKHVPADTPYFMGALEPLPDSYWQRYSGLSDQLMKAIGDLQPSQAELDREPALRLLFAIFRELGGKLNAKGLSELGIAVGGPHVVYGVGLLPVLRVRLSSAQAFRALLNRVVHEAGLEMPPERSFQGQTYWRWDDEKLALIMAIRADELVVAVTAQSSSDLGLLLGVEPPSQSLANTSTLRDLMSQYDFHPGWLGMLRIHAVATAVGNPDERVAAQLRALADRDDLLSPDCDRAAQNLTAHVPRLAFGYYGPDSPWDGGTVLETSELVGLRLQGLVSDMPGVGPTFDPQPLMVMALNLNADPVLAELIALGNAFGASECDEVRDLATKLAALEHTLQGPAAVLREVRGAHVAVHEVRGELQANAEIRAHVLLGHSDPGALLNMLRPLIGIMGVQIPAVEDGAEPVRINAPGLPKYLSKMLIARAGSNLAISVGSAMATTLEDALHAPPRSDRPAMIFGYDERRWNDMTARFLPDLQARGADGSDTLDKLTASGFRTLDVHFQGNAIIGRFTTAP